MAKAKTLLIQLLVGVILLEIILRCLYFQKLGNDKIAIVSAYKSVAFRATDNYKERLVKNHNLIRPDSAHVNEAIVDEVIASNAFEYTPWADFKLKDYQGAYVNSKGFLRKSIPDKSISAGEDTISIFMLGGSTMFGFDVMDKETIPSAFADIYAQQCSNCKPVQVFNYGVLSYYSYNELMLFHHLLATQHRPDVVVFLDGMNDLFIMQAARKRIPWYYFRLKQTVQNVKDSTASLFQLKPGQTNISAADDVLRNYFENVNHIKKLCNAYNVTPFFFIQPTPFYNYPGQRADPVADTARKPAIEYGYTILKSKCASDSNMIFLGDMLKNETGRPFIDEIHYSPDMNRKIAEEIFNSIRSKMELKLSNQRQPSSG
jgi:lysophospholipase L1-like esterase